MDRAKDIMWMSDIFCINSVSASATSPTAACRAMCAALLASVASEQASRKAIPTRNERGCPCHHLVIRAPRLSSSRDMPHSASTKGATQEETARSWQNLGNDTSRAAAAAVMPREQPSLRGNISATRIKNLLGRTPGNHAIR